MKKLNKVGRRKRWERRKKIKKSTETEFRCEGCGKLLAHWNEKEQCSYTDIPCGEGLWIEKETGKGYCDKCVDN